MRRCVVYELVGSYCGGLLFIPVEYDSPALKDRLDSIVGEGDKKYRHYERLGEMDVDDTVIKFVKCGPNDEWEDADYTSMD